MKRLTALLLSLLLLFSALPFSVFALDSYEPLKTNNEIKDQVSLKEGDKTAFKVTIPKSGKYSVKVTYFIEEIHGNYVDLNLEIDGKATKNTSYQLGVSYLLGTVGKDTAGNQLTPEWSMEEKWYEQYLCFEDSFSVKNAAFELSQGEHNITLAMLDGAVKLQSVVFIETKEQIDYSAYLKTNDYPKTKIDAEPITVQAEKLSYATSKVILPFCDSSSAKVTPVANKLQVINSLGGAAWNLIGQEGIWEFEIPTDGWYSVSVRYRQDYTDGRAVIRSLKIDGESPFSECEAIAFPYETNWTNIEAGNGSEVYSFYLTKGKHTISLAPAIGEMVEVLSSVQEVLANLNDIYRKIIKITSSTPDTYRDYRLDEKIPDTIENIKKESDRLSQLIDKMPEGTNSAILERTVQQLLKMYKSNDTIAGSLAEFQSNMSSIGTWINDQKTQPLALDEITVFPSNMKYEKKTVGFFASVWHSLKRFLYSFTSEYEVGGNTESIEVWAITGRDQVQILRRLVNETFTPKENIYADIRLIASTALLPAVVAGIGPDVALSEPNTTPVNFASRDAIYDLSQFSDLGEVTSQFAEASLTPLKYEGGLYALPETLNFNMLFYRTDIFSEYGWEVPKTWDDVRNLIFDLSKNNMQFGFTSGFGTYCILLAQKGGTVYSPDGKYSTLNEQPALEAFEEYTQLYSEYKIPVSFNFANRFRSGEMPIAITGYTAYNTLEVFAPEIKGLWDIAVVPGTKTENGVINHASTADGVCSFILKDTKNPDASWEFLKWWTSADVQAKYGNSVEEKLGASARYAPANTEALALIPWSTAFYNELSTQLDNVVGIPEVPGGYFTPRNFNNAFRATVYDSQDARETLLQYVEVINDEITRKRKEFGLSVKE